MMIDSSALLAILFAEEEAARIARAIDADAVRLLPAPNYLEITLWLVTRYGEDGGEDLRRLIERSNIEIVDFTALHAEIAKRAFARFGKGRHPAALNFGDCMAYALAKDTGEPLLFKGTDFGLTDVAVAEY